MPPAEPARRRTGRVRAALALGLVLAVGATGTWAYWTDTVPVSGTTISTGTLNLQVNNLDEVPTYTALTLGGMVPGNSTAGVLTVRNAGTVPLTYYATSTSSDPTLTPLLAVKVTGDAAVTGTGLSETCAGSPLGGTGTTFGGNLVGTPTARRTLQPNAAETLCVQATLAADAPNAAQAKTTTVTFAFNASQVV